MVPVRRVLPAFLGLVLVLVGACVLASPVLAVGDANEAGCPNESSPGFRSYLPDCRGYELVTPPYDEGSPLALKSYISQDGERVIFSTRGVIAGTGNDEVLRPASYEAQRDSAGSQWSITALEPSSTTNEMKGWADTELERVLLAPNELQREPDGTLVEVGPGINFTVGISADLNHVLINSSEVWPGDTASQGQSLYEYEGTGNSEPTLVGVSNQEALHGVSHVNEGAILISDCGTELGGKNSKYNAVSSDGGMVFFTAKECAGNPAVNELYVRVNRSRTVDISEPVLPPSESCDGACASATREPAQFQGASQDGSVVTFLTSQPLLNEDEKGEGTGIDLYEDVLEGASVKRVIQVSHDPHEGEAADVMGVVRVSEDGSHVYFVAGGVLTEGANSEGKTPTPGAPNLYVYERDARFPDGKTMFVGTLQSSVEEGEAEETCFQFAIENRLFEYEQCEGLWSPVHIWKSNDNRAAQATPDGRFLVFPSLAHLTSDDKSKAAQLFEYDAESERLTRVSIGQVGYNQDGNTNDPLRGAQIRSLQYGTYDSPVVGQSSVNVTEDGRVFFMSTDRLTPQAIEGYQNVYEYKDGDVYLISDGQDRAIKSGVDYAVELLGTDESGRDVFFTTSDSLTPQDTNTQIDIYDARTGGGFPQMPPSAACHGEGCQGALSAAPVLGVPGSTVFAGPGNVAPLAESKPAVKSKPKPKAKKKKKKRKKVSKKRGRAKGSSRSTRRSK